MYGALLYMAQRPGYYGNWRKSIWRESNAGAVGVWRRLNG